MPVLDVGERLNTQSGRFDLAADLIGVMVYPDEKTQGAGGGPHWR